MAGNSTELRVSADMLGLLAGEDLARLEAKGRAGYTCVDCGRRGSIDDGPASVVVLAEEDGPASRAVLRLGHAACCNPEVRSGTHLRPPEGARMLAAAGVLAHPAGDRPVLVTELTAVTAAVTGPGERADLGAGELLRLGLHLLADPWEPAPRSGGWAAAFPPGRAVVTDPEGGEFYRGTVDFPPGWPGLAARQGAVELLAGADGIAGGGAAVPRALESAAAAGRAR